MDKTVRKILKIAPSFSLKSYVFLKSIVFPFSKIESSVPKAGNIIEVGCSYGLTAAYLALKSKKRKIIGLDNNKERIRSAKRIWKRIPNLRFRTRSLLEKVAIKRNQVILAVDLLHHVPLEQQRQFLSSCYEKFDQTNLLIIKEIDKKPFFKFLLNYIGDMLMNPEGFYFKDSRVLKKELERTGFDVGYKEIKHILYPHYVLICRKR